MARAVFPTATDYVWLAHTWNSGTLVFHTNAARDERPWVDDKGHQGTIAGWAFTVCGQVIYPPRWEDAMSPRTGRFYGGDPRGTQLPLRLLNPGRVRPCRKCFDVEATRG